MRKLVLYFTLSLVVFPCRAQRRGFPSHASSEVDRTPVPTDFRDVEGRLYNIVRNTNWLFIEGKCLSVKTNGIIIQTFRTNNVYTNSIARGHVSDLQRIGGGGFSPAVTVPHLASSEVIPAKRIFLRNISGKADDESISVRAMRVGTIAIGDSTLEDWDCGTQHVFTQPVHSPEEIEAAKKAQADKATAAKLRVIEFKKDQASNGVAYAQFDLGKLYAVGDGVESNRFIAIHWLTLAAEQKYPGASNELEKLKGEH